MTYVQRVRRLTIEEARHRLIEAARAYRSARTDEYVARLVRDDAIVEAHRAGLSSRAIGELVGGMDQANVVRARRRTATRRAAAPDGLLSPADAVRRSGLGPGAFVAAVHEGRIRVVETGGEARSFRPEDVDALQREN